MKFILLLVTITLSTSILFEVISTSDILNTFEGLKSPVKDAFIICELASISCNLRSKPEDIILISAFLTFSDNSGMFIFVIFKSPPYLISLKLPLRVILPLVLKLDFLNIAISFE